VAQSNRQISQPPSSRSSRPRVRDQQPLSQHIDKPLRRHVWTSRNRTWTRLQLDRERDDFFDTRVTGRAEVWQTIRAALEVLWEADVSRRAGANDTPPSSAGESGPRPNTALATSQSILRAAEITLPTGDLANGVYDALGHYYALPEWIVVDPIDVTDSQDQPSEDVDRKVEDDLTGEDTTEEIDDEAALRRREEKGKGVVDVRDMVKIRARLSEDARDIIVSVRLSESVRSVSRKVLEESGVCLPKPAPTCRTEIC
jgi:hypothetical protein